MTVPQLAKKALRNLESNDVINEEDNKKAEEESHKEAEK